MILAQLTALLANREDFRFNSLGDGDSRAATRRRIETLAPIERLLADDYHRERAGMERQAAARAACRSARRAHLALAILHEAARRRGPAARPGASIDVEALGEALRASIPV